ncbi:hypothetical protein [Ileibacterium valens]|uniref:Ribosomal protein L7Ae/L30e/S12e/Gadd45 domain-containing protein n=1 Tax=Ileibacterium valens TaxID=1862668 RepID=A0A1U7NDM9_9FIRM|nr:hypothetical protein [Ileibacterium valens]OLU37452.1 hypothetical protein BO222_10580 [Ileibacterium valens]OLU39242.1 hypothetical protein BO224_07585 [Erysipelotrichaceae bacterium NYU-BL-E8]OLU42278.1 hypothetical protein BM735_02535 [Erysipelotrichaceae bacterium NYU-BL-F16]
MQDKVVNSIQMAIRAGKTIRGEGLIPSIINGSSKLVIYTSTIGNNSKKKILNKSKTAGIPAFELDELRFNSISNKAASAYGITDQGFAASLIEKLTSDKSTSADFNLSADTEKK